MEKKTIKLKYVDHDSKVITPADGPFWNILSKRYNIEPSDDPDYVIYGPFGDEHLRYFDAVKIFYTGECITPDFNLCDYAIGFDYLEFGDRYFRYPLWLKYGREQNLRMEHKHLDINASLAKRDFCSYVVSNEDGDAMRDQLFDYISEYKKIDSGGRYRNNIGIPNGVSDKLEFQKSHKFALACENCSHIGYTTEKLMEAFEAQTVPIYWGDPEVVRDFNPDSFISCNGKSLQEVLEEVIRIDQDDAVYMNMLSQPALKGSNQGILVREKELEEFLYGIFDQDKEVAFRRNRICWGRRYNADLFGRKLAFEKQSKKRNTMKKLANIVRVGRK